MMSAPSGLHCGVMDGVALDRALLRCAAAYVTFFAYLGACGPLWTTYLTRQLGFSETLVGGLGALLVLSLVVGGTLFARVADGWRCRRSLQRALSLMGALACAGWLFVTTPAA